MPSSRKRSTRRPRRPRATPARHVPAIDECTATIGLASDLLRIAAASELNRRGMAERWGAPDPLPDGDALVDWSFMVASRFVTRAAAMMAGPALPPPTATTP